MPAKLTFRQELAQLINRRSLENESNTPDFILAEFLADSLTAFDHATRTREQWHDRAPKAVEIPLHCQTESRKAFTLVEIMICVVILGLAIVISIPACEKIRRHSEVPAQSQSEPEYRLFLAWERMEIARNRGYSTVSFEQWKMLRAAGLLTPHSTAVEKTR